MSVDVSACSHLMPKFLCRVCSADFFPSPKLELRPTRFTTQEFGLSAEEYRRGLEREYPTETSGVFRDIPRKVERYRPAVERYRPKED